MSKKTKETPTRRAKRSQKGTSWFSQIRLLGSGARRIRSALLLNILRRCGQQPSNMPIRPNNSDKPLSKAKVENRKSARKSLASFGVERIAKARITSNFVSSAVCLSAINCSAAWIFLSSCSTCLAFSTNSAISLSFFQPANAISVVNIRLLSRTKTSSSTLPTLSPLDLSFSRISDMRLSKYSRNSRSYCVLPESSPPVSSWPGKFRGKWSISIA
mmetsp:Transcript_14020/g.40352  ORF Transcript_14020/g.40352 Transcript_14020/m.40352 type:complete len:216 (+) Transcript_14020:1968-2615(+)